MTEEQISGLRKKLSGVLCTGCYLDLSKKHVDFKKINTKEFLVVSISGGDLEKEMVGTYGKEWEEKFFPSISGQEKKLAPSWSIFSDYKESLIDGKTDLKKIELEYISRYRKERFNKFDIYNFLEKKYSQMQEEKKTKIIFLCYENTREFCHRHIFAKDLEKLLEVKIPEYSLELQGVKTQRKRGRLVYKV